MTKKRWPLEVAIVAALLGTGLAFFVALADPRNGAMWSKYSRLKIGMTSGEVEEIMGPQIMPRLESVWTQEDALVHVVYKVENEQVRAAKIEWIEFDDSPIDRVFFRLGIWRRPRVLE